MTHEHREANRQSCRAQTSIAPLISHSKDADNKLQGEEDLNGGGHAKADAWLQLKNGGKVEQLIHTFECTLSRDLLKINIVIFYFI